MISVHVQCVKVDAQMSSTIAAMIHQPERLVHFRCFMRNVKMVDGSAIPATITNAASPRVAIHSMACADRRSANTDRS